eukprot:Skav201919  [mRNA]  locus=scaffold3992:230923:236262:+ [translate_table: standard]
MAWWQPAVGSAALTVGVVLWQVKRRDWAESHTWKTAVQQKYVGELRLRQVLSDASRAEAVQRNLLEELLRRHQATAYGAAALESVDSWEAYRKTQKITWRGAGLVRQYSDYEGYIQQICQGYSSVLSPGPAPRLAMTSATAGQPKGGLVALAVLQRHFPESTSLQRTLKLAFRAQKLQLESGRVTMGCKRAPDSPNFDRLLCAYSSPKAAYDIMHEPDAMYAHALFALKDQDLGMLEANFASNIFLQVSLEEPSQPSFVRDHCDSLATDLEQGRIWSKKSPEVPISEEHLAALNVALRLSGDGAARAQELRRLVAGDGFVAQLWPKLRLVVAVTGGNFEAATRRRGEMAQMYRLRRLLGGVPIYSPFYAATEGLLGVNISPNQAWDGCGAPSITWGGCRYSGGTGDAPSRDNDFSR